MGLVLLMELDTRPVITQAIIGKHERPLGARGQTSQDRRRGLAEEVRALGLRYLLACPLSTSRSRMRVASSDRA